jgi:hypothetical protein
MSEPLHVGCGSIASIPRCPRYVRLCSKSGDKADMETLRVRAISGSSAGSFDHLVGAGEQRRGHVEAERLGCPEIDKQFDFRGLLNRRRRARSRLFLRSRRGGRNENCAGPSGNLLPPSPPAEKAAAG